MSERANVVITVSDPYVLIAGGWTGMRPVGLRRTYKADVDGRQFVNTNKAEIQSVIRHSLYPARVTFTFEASDG